MADPHIQVLVQGRKPCDLAELQRLADRVMSDRRFCADEHHKALALGVLSLIAENDALRKDAERYQWLRDHSESIHQFYLSTPIWFTGVKFSKENVDRTIDAAMGNGEQS